jgi:hypothetical protein
MIICLAIFYERRMLLCLFMMHTVTRVVLVQSRLVIATACMRSTRACQWATHWPHLAMVCTTAAQPLVVLFVKIVTLRYR